MMRRKFLITALCLISCVAGIAGCQSTAQRGLPLSQTRRETSNEELADRENEPQTLGREVTLEPEEKVTSDNSWTRLLNPFAKPKKRIPLPLSKPSSEEGDESLAGF